MNKNFSLNTIVAFAITCTTTGIAQADESKFYVGGGLTNSKFDICDSSVVDTEFRTLELDESCSDTGGTVFLGYEINKNFSIEGGFDPKRYRDSKNYRNV